MQIRTFKKQRSLAMTTETLQLTNGVDVNQLTETIEHIQENPALAQFRFRSTTEWIDGGHSRTQIKGFYGAGQEDTSRTESYVLEGDEPPVLLGSNKAPNAVETVLHALASCLAVGFIYNAAAQGITVDSLELDLEGEMDLHGFLGLSDQTRAGYRGITVNYRVETDAPDEKVDELCAYVQRTSPVMDILRNPVPVTVQRTS